MKRLLFLFVSLYPLLGTAHEGIPFFVNYSSSVYQAHNRNFDVTCDRNGHLFIANFEGVLHYDYNRWEVLYAPGYSRITRLFNDSQGHIWFGGYNVFGRITYDDRGCLMLKTIICDIGKKALGEFEDITEVDGNLFLRTTKGRCYKVKNDSTFISVEYLPKKVQEEWGKQPPYGINQELILSNGWIVRATQYNGLIVLDEKRTSLYTLTERNGLCSNSISHIATDDKGNLWGVTDNGVFRVFLPSLFSRYTSQEGLKGEVVSVARYNEKLYVGTLQGLYLLEKNRFIQIKDIKQACWTLCISSENELYAAASDGLFLIHKDKYIDKITERAVFSLVFTGKTEFLFGAMEGIFRCELPKRNIQRLNNIEKVISLEKKENLSIEAKTIYGEVYIQKNPNRSFMRFSHREQESMTLYTDQDGYCWQTDLKGKNLYVDHLEYNTNRINRYLSALRNYVVRVIYIEEGGAVWIGGDFGLIRFDLQKVKTDVIHSPKIFLREICLNQDSILQKDFFVPNQRILHLEDGMHNFRFSFATDAPCFTGTNLYRYKLDGYDSEWSIWSTINSKEYVNLSAGDYTFFIQSKDIYGNESDVEEVQFSLLTPFYLKWYSILLYIFIFSGLIYLLFRWRVCRLLREKEKLEQVVNQRTLELLEQKKEIEEKSNRLEITLEELKQAQVTLVRQEKMATVGKLTQGLIDRILNPLNYICNFSHLTTGLVRELCQNLKKTPKQLDEETYLDSLDVAEMVTGNLRKIEEHGENTTRILKAMEEVLKNRSRQLGKVELIGLCEECVKQLNTYYEKEINSMSISVKFSLPDKPLYIHANTEQFGKTLIGLMNDSIYAITKKYNKKAYVPEISITVEKDENKKLVTITLYDNGIGIESSILDRIFDPFFTTKTTGEAAGIGLFLGKEVVINHNGQIMVSSEKDTHTRFTIVLPLLKEE